MYFDEYNADNDISENSLIFLLDEKNCAVCHHVDDTGDHDA